jgi:hypothetical protein
MAFVREEMKRLIKFIIDERGSVESSLVLIPLLILFLLGFQLSIAVHARNSAQMSVQAEATAKAISGEFDADDEFIHIDTSGDGQNLDLLVTARRDKLSDLIPGFLGGYSSHREIYLQGVAIVENRR